MSAINHRVEDLQSLFDGLFFKPFNTRLIRGDDEPVYLPADADCSYHRIIFAHGFFASALHEIAHWCIAGEARRQRVDFGYWYEPDGRSAAQQHAFEQVEVKPQALEWIFSAAAGKPFRVSVDNLDGEAGDSDGFKDAVFAQVLDYCREGLPQRAASLRTALANFYGEGRVLQADQFCRGELL